MEINKSNNNNINSNQIQSTNIEFLKQYEFQPFLFLIFKKKFKFFDSENFIEYGLGGLSEFNLNPNLKFSSFFLYNYENKFKLFAKIKTQKVNFDKDLFNFNSKFLFIINDHLSLSGNYKKGFFAQNIKGRLFTVFSIDNKDPKSFQIKYSIDNSKNHYLELNIPITPFTNVIMGVENLNNNYKPYTCIIYNP